MKLTEEHIEQIAGYMADDLEDYLDTTFWDGIARVLDACDIEYDDIGEISDEDCEAIVLQTRIMFAPKND
tara:strand:- start:1188 stop:1397 length:210 start_codon:yes stop_codon:yes gene_type:complete